MTTARNLALLSKHLDLLPPVKQPLAGWLCEDWSKSAKRGPGAFRKKYGQLYPFQLSSSEAPEGLLRELVLELLSTHLGLVSRRERVGANRRTRLGPRRNAG